jgi:hypothetical protein
MEERTKKVHLPGKQSCQSGMAMNPMQEKTDSALPTNRRGNGEPAGIPSNAIGSI